jgi:hypothetical protein
MTDEEFVRRVEDCTLPPGLFNHVGHVRLAWTYLQRQAPLQAADSSCAAIRRYAQALGAAGKFHCTVTVALVRLIADRHKARLGEDFAAFLESNAALLADARGALSRHYSDARLQSDDARARFVEPDLLPLP